MVVPAYMSVILVDTVDLDIWTIVVISSSLLTSIQVIGKVSLFVICYTEVRLTWFKKIWTKILRTFCFKGVWLWFTILCSYPFTGYSWSLFLTPSPPPHSVSSKSLFYDGNVFPMNNKTKSKCLSHWWVRLENNLTYDTFQVTWFTTLCTCTTLTDPNRWNRWTTSSTTSRPPSTASNSSRHSSSSGPALRLTTIFIQISQNEIRMVLTDNQ